MFRLTITAVTLLVIPAGNALCADAISIDSPRPLSQLAVQLWDRYGYLVTYEEAPVDPDREVVTRVYARDRVDHTRVSKPVTFHVARGKAASPRAQVDGNAETETRLPLSQELMQPLIDEYNSSGNPGKFSVTFDGTYAHIYTVSRMVGGRMEDFEPILATKVSMPPQAILCFDIFNSLFAELTRMRGISVIQGVIDANLLYRHQCTIIGTDLTARDVLAQIADQLGSGSGIGSRAPAEKLRFAWSLLYHIPTGQYVLSLNWVPNKPSARSETAVSRQN